MKFENDRGFICSFVDEYAFLSNFYQCHLYEDVNTDKGIVGLVFDSAEAQFQSHKTLDLTERKKFTKMSPKDAKHYGRRVKLRKDWEEIKDDLMFWIVFRKFYNNVPLQHKLMMTGKTPIIEGNTWGDTYWGMVKKKIPNGNSMVDTWVGENRLGYILMKVRDIMIDKWPILYYGDERLIRPKGDVIDVLNKTTFEEYQKAKAKMIRTLTSHEIIRKK